MINRKDVQKLFDELGIKPTDCVTKQTSLSSIGGIDGGAKK